MRSYCTLNRDVFFKFWNSMFNRIATAIRVMRVSIYKRIEFGYLRTLVNLQRYLQMFANPDERRRVKLEKCYDGDFYAPWQ